MASNGTTKGLLARREKAAAPELPAAPSASELARVAELFAPIPLTPEQARQFALIEGSDEEPWDVLLQLLALDEHQALELLGKRTGLDYVPEPRMHESASRFYEIVPADVARGRLCAGLGSDGQVVRVATAQPMQPGVFAMLEDLLGMPIRLVLTPRAGVANLIN